MRGKLTKRYAELTKMYALYSPKGTLKTGLFFCLKCGKHVKDQGSCFCDCFFYLFLQEINISEVVIAIVCVCVEDIQSLMP